MIRARSLREPQAFESAISRRRGLACTLRWRSPRASAGGLSPPLASRPDPRPVVLVIDDESGVRTSVKMVLDPVCDVLEAPDGPAGIEVLERLKRLDPGLEVVLVTAVRTVRTAVEAMKLGAYDYLTKPFAADDL